MKIKKLLSLLTMTVVVAGIVPATYGQVLHKKTQEQTVTNGVVHISEEILTDNGWQDINILKIDLKNDAISLKPIESRALGERKNILQLAQNEGAVAAVNADFFDMGTSTGTSFGPVAKEGKLYHSYNMHYTNLGPKKYMASMLLDEQQEVYMDYYGVQLAVAHEDGKLFDIGSHNILTGSLGRPIVIDSSYYSDNNKVIQKYQAEGVYSVVVEDGMVTYRSQQNEVVQVPANGFVIALNGSYANQYYNQLEIGAGVNLVQDVMLGGEVVQAINDLEMGIGGGGLIMKGGQAYTGNAHKVSGDKREPRTVVATTYVPGEVLLLTVDGRNKTLGANHQDLIGLLQSYGAKDAMYFDGGGSTTLVARNEGDQAASLQNKPSGGNQRSVVNGLGVFTSEVAGALNEILLATTRNRTFIEEGISVTVKGVDENHNPVTINEDSLNLSVAGVSGYWKGKTFYPTSEGKGLIVATQGDVTATQEITVSALPKAIQIEPSKLQLDAQTSKKVQVYGIDQAGYRIPLSADQMTWVSNNQSVTAKGSEVSAQGEAVALLTANYKGVKGNMEVVVGNTVRPIESFETPTGKWGGDTTTVKGTVEPSKEIKYHGEQSLKMTYTFDKSANKQVAYTVFDKPIAIPTDTYALNMWVHAKGQGDTLKVQLKDAKGQTHYLKLADRLGYDGWKYLSVVLPEEIVLPAQITKVYTYANTVNQKRTSAIYMDHVSTTRGGQSKSGITLRQDHLFDKRYKESLQAPSAGQYQIKVIGPTQMSSIVMSGDTKNQVANNLSVQTDLLIQASQQNTEFGVQVPTYTYNNQMNEVIHKDIQTLFVGTDKGGIRATNAEQWLKVKEALEASSASHTILVMSQNPLTQFADSREGKAFHDYLVEHKQKTGKSIFVVTTGGYDNETRIEDGVTYIRLHGAAVPSDDLTKGTYLTFKIVGDQIYYTFAPMM
ncbi:MAG: phosphodiester glycosidase family protein [Cellulosilyticaceae bacterium]